MTYDYLIVGAGVYGASFARLATDAGKHCLVIDRRDTIAGNVYDERVAGVLVNRYGGHIFHTNSEPIWDFVNRFSEFSRYEHRVKANFKGRLFSFPINLATFRELWGLEDLAEVQERLERERVHFPRPQNFEEHVLSQVGEEIYETFFKGYTEKQWGTHPRNLPVSVAKRIPIRLTDDDRYFDDKFQGMPVEGYTAMVHRMLDGIEVRLGEDYTGGPVGIRWPHLSRARVVYSGPLDELFDYRYGKLGYRSLRFEHEFTEPFGHATINYTDAAVPYTRIIDWAAFRPEQYQGSAQTPHTREYPASEGEPYYPINNDANHALYQQYRALVPDWMIVGGRLGSYQYLNMDQAIGMAMKDFRRET